MKLGDKAEAADRDEVRLARDSVGIYRLEADELVPADEISDEGDFPKYGDFLSCHTTTGGANPEWNTPVLVEVPGSLAKQLVGLDIEPGDAFRIQSARKNASGEWQYSVSEEDSDL